MTAIPQAVKMIEKQSQPKKVKTQLISSLVNRFVKPVTRRLHRIGIRAFPLVFNVKRIRKLQKFLSNIFISMHKTYRKIMNIRKLKIPVAEQDKRIKPLLRKICKQMQRLDGAVGKHKPKILRRPNRAQLRAQIKKLRRKLHRSQQTNARHTKTIRQLSRRNSKLTRAINRLTRRNSRLARTNRQRSRQYSKLRRQVVSRQRQHKFNTGHGALYTVDGGKDLDIRIVDH